MEEESETGQVLDTSGVLATESRLAGVEAENFQLKLRIYFLEQRLDPKQASLVVWTSILPPQDQYVSLQAEQEALHEERDKLAASLETLGKRHDRVKTEAKRIATENFVLIDQYKLIKQASCF